ncbi:ABC transporter permease [Thiohalocapsa marina]|uniref:ABC transporter permease n=1 Tax=Thiohalocapsa marina TaxID=424902 RepID=A0A5M8FUI4_9GAMM|nr:ABC transporter permease [Thiohalocapsa marina]KAA6187433.1 ABC transporter permease [Thiohalocapsa marina]
MPEHRQALLGGRAEISILTLPPFVWLLVFFLVPVLILAALSFSPAGMTVEVFRTPSLEHYRQSLDPFYLGILLRSIGYAASATLITLLIAFPAAYFIASSPPRRQVWLLFLVFLPLWTNLLVRLYSFKIILGDNGLVNQLLQALSIVGEPLSLIYTPLAVVVGFVYWNLPYMIPPIYAALERMNPSLLEASMDLGASRAQTFRHVIVPASLPGVTTGVILCFVPTLGSFIVPDILGGPESMMVGNVIAAQFGQGLNWPFGSALATLLTLLVTVGVTLYIRYGEPGSTAAREARA